MFACKRRIGKYIYNEKVGHVNIYAIDVREGKYIYIYIYIYIYV